MNVEELKDPETATVFAALLKTGFSVRFLYQYLYGMTKEEADVAWQMYKDERVDMEGNFILAQANQRSAEWLKERENNAK